MGVYHALSVRRLRRVDLRLFLLFLLFNSVKLAGLIILVLPFASVGGLIGLFFTGEYLSVPASVGFILNSAVTLSSRADLADTKAAGGG